MRSITLYEFPTLDLDSFTESYLHETLPHEVIDEGSMSVFDPAKTFVTKKKRGTVNIDKIHWKCMYLQDAIIRLAFCDEGRTFSLNAGLLRTIIGQEYKIMLNLLVELGYIEMGDGEFGANHYYWYIPSKYSTLYTMKDVPVDTVTIPFNKAISDYKAKTEEYMKRRQKQLHDRVAAHFGETFLECYQKSLNKFLIEDKRGFSKALAEQIKENPNAKPYYNYLLSELGRKEKRLYKMDDSHRIYHVLTNLKRDYKKYLNIDFCLDCKNSHPLLFNFWIFTSHGIPKHSSYRICNYINACIELESFPLTPSLHNDVQNLRKELIDNNVEIQELAKLSDNELEYIFLTSKGLLWDLFCAKHPDKSRAEVKEALFGSVFYSNSRNAYRWNEYANEFRQRFPDVYALIADLKSSTPMSVSLPVAMMSLEADIFTTILKRLYMKRWNAVHIHDCIVIPKDGSKSHPKKKQVVKIAEAVFKEFGLCPSFS